MSRTATRRLLALAGPIVVLAACTAAPGGTRTNTPGGSGTAPSGAATLTIYSGREEELVGELFARYERQAGVDVEVKYGDSAELASLLAEEGDRSRADVFFAQDAGSLGAVAEEGLLGELPDQILGRVDARFRARDGSWVGTSGRARVVAYDTRELSEDELPDSILDFTDPAWKGRLGWAPENGSFQAFVTALRVLEGDDAARDWLEGMLANEPKQYARNTAIVEAVAAGEIDAGFPNHYYLLRLKEEHGDEYPVENHFLGGGDPGALVNVAGAGIVSASDSPEAAQDFVDFLLSESSQEYFATETFEYPLVAGIAADPRLRPLSELEPPEIDLGDLRDLRGTLTLLSETGVLH